MIKVTNVTRVYQNGGQAIKALDGVSLEIGQGELVAIVGRSGSGKTTLMNLLGCLDTATSGNYLLDGRQVTGLAPDMLAELRRDKLGFVFQSFHLLKHMTAVENVEAPLMYSGVEKRLRREIATGALAAVGLKDRLDHKPSELSGGQQQRVAIARAMVTNPPVLLADEPTGNLDAESGMEVVGLLRKMNEIGHTVVIITHDPVLAELAQRKITISEGKII